MATADCEIMTIDNRVGPSNQPGFDIISSLKSEMDDWTRGIVSGPCPDCGTSGAVVRSGRCVACMDCGWCLCSRR